MWARILGLYGFITDDPHLFPSEEELQDKSEQLYWWLIGFSIVSSTLDFSKIYKDTLANTVLPSDNISLGF